MNPSELERLALTYGADLGRWPENRKAEAERLLAERPALATVLARARQLDAALAAERAEISDQRLARLTASLRERAAQASQPGLGWDWDWGWGWIERGRVPDLSALAAGALVAIAIAWLVQSARPEAAGALSAGVAPPANAILAILELEGLVLESTE